MTLRIGSSGRPKGADKNDCQVRAMATARSMPYRAAWELLYALQGEHRWCSFCLVECLKAGDRRVGFVRELSFPAKRGQRRMTGAQFCKRYPKGRYILRLSHHVVAVVDGEMFDTWDSSRKCVYKAWEVRSC